MFDGEYITRRQAMPRACISTTWMKRPAWDLRREIKSRNQERRRGLAMAMAFMAAAAAGSRGLCRLRRIIGTGLNFSINALIQIAIGCGFPDCELYENTTFGLF